MDSKRHIIRLKEEQIAHLNQVIANDSMFLMSKGIMDYSFLIKSEIKKPENIYDETRNRLISSD